MTVKDVVILAIVVLLGVPLVIVLGTKMPTEEKVDIKVSLPEEIMQAEKGDILIVEKVTDSVYIGFKPKKK